MLTVGWLILFLSDSDLSDLASEPGPQMSRVIFEGDICEYCLVAKAEAAPLNDALLSFTGVVVRHPIVAELPH